MTQTLLTVASRALRLIGELAAGSVPGGADGADMLIAANAMKRAWFGTLIGSRLSPFSLSGATGQAESGGEYLIGGSTAMTLQAPLSPRAGARFGVVDAGVNFATHNLTINGNGSLIAGAATAVQNVNGAAARYWFRADTGSWTLEADWASLSSVIEFPDVVAAYFPYMLAVVVASEYGQDIPPDVALGASEGRTVLSRTYARRGVTGLDPVIGLSPPPQPGPSAR